MANVSTMQPIHPLAHIKLAGSTDANGKHTKWRQSQRGLLLGWTPERAGMTCRICADTGRYQCPPLLPIFEEALGSHGQVTEAQIENYMAHSRKFVIAVPCWNPACAAPKPENACAVCGGFGQVVRDGVLTDQTCMDCLGFGVTPANDLAWLDAALDELAAAAVTV